MSEVIAIYEEDRFPPSLYTSIRLNTKYGHQENMNTEKDNYIKFDFLYLYRLFVYNIYYLLI